MYATRGARGALYTLLHGSPDVWRRVIVWLMRLGVVVGLAAACHGGNPATTDASSPGGDAPPMIDAAIDAIPRGTITVTVYGTGVDRNPGVPVPGATVDFVEPDQTTTTITTGNDGIATAQVPDNTTIWIAHHNGSSIYAIETYEGARIGDSIVGGNPTPLGPDQFAGAAYIAYPQFSDATSYTLVLSCTSGYTPNIPSPWAQNFYACPQEMTANAIVWATDSMGNLGYTSATGVDLTAHGTAGTAVALPAFQPGATVGVTFTNLPAALGETNADIYARYTMGADPIALQQVHLYEGTLTDTMTASTAIAPFGDRTRVFGSVYIAANAYEYNVDTTFAGLSSSVTIDASMMVHPAKTWQYDAPTNRVTWDQLGFGVDPTIVYSVMDWNAPTGIGWYLVAPYSGNPALPLPTPPADLATVLPSPSDALARQVDMYSYAGKTYHDALLGQVSGASSWHIGVIP